MITTGAILLIRWCDKFLQKKNKRENLQFILQQIYTYYNPI